MKLRPTQNLPPTGRPELRLNADDWFICACGCLVFTRLADNHAEIVHHQEQP